MIDPWIKSLLGYELGTADAKVSAEWRRRTKAVCKPCWELKYCPYGPLVEQFPLPPIPRAEMVAHNEMLKDQLRAGISDPERRGTVKKMVENFNPKDYPVKADTANDDKACSVFGHYCPVFFVNEPLTETQELRRVGRRIPREIILRVVRRDNNQCQSCARVLKDNEIEFDHVIPVSKGGSSEEHNLRVACFDCNRSKSNRFQP
jgi:HNH endonuclease